MRDHGHQLALQAPTFRLLAWLLKPKTQRFTRLRLALFRFLLLTA